MIKNYFVTALRSLFKNKLFSLLNIGGLAIGLAACILIFLFVRDEVSYDTFLPNVDQMYRLEGAFKTQDGALIEMALSPGRLKETLQNDYPEIEAIARVYNEGHVILKGNDVFIETVTYVDPDIFKIFDLEIVAGNREDIFNDNTSIMIDEAMAKKYFGDENPIGKILELDDEDWSFKVVAVMKNLPQNTHLDFQFLGLFDPERYKDRPWVAENWLSSNLYTYVQLETPKDAQYLEDTIPEYLDRNVPRTSPSGVAMVGDPHDNLSITVRAVKDIHLYSQGRFQMKPGGDIVLVYSFSVIAILILVIASINFINLSTAKSSLRAKEIAIRKVAGANRKQLIGQFLGETGLTVLISLILAILIVQLALPFFGEFVAKLLALNVMGDPVIQLGLFGLLVVVGIGAGLQPAFQISAFKPGEVLKSNKSKAGENSKLRIILVTFQFAISIGLMATTIIVYNQTQFAKNMDYGFKTQNKIQISNMTYGDIEDVAKTIQQEIETLPGVTRTTFTERGMPINGFWSGPITLLGRESDTTVQLEPFKGDFDYLQFYDATLLAGRLFSEDFLGDKRKPLEGESEGSFEDNVIINETALRSLGFNTPEAAIGESIRYIGFNGRLEQRNIIGVVKDMYLRSLREEVQSMIYSVPEDNLQFLMVELDPVRAEETLLEIDQLWEKHVPTFPIRRSYWEENLEGLYLADEERGQMFAYFALFAILVSCLGLFGLASFTVERKTMEIGVRKVMGAKIRDIIRLLLWQFSKPVLVANILAWPVAWYFMSDWLQGFAYRINMTPLPFIAAGLTALLIAWGTVSFHAWRVARTNPIKALRYE